MEPRRVLTALLPSCLTAVQKCPRPPAASAQSPEDGLSGGSAVLEGRLLLEVSAPPPPRDHTPVTSCGVAVCPYHGSSRDMLQDGPGAARGLAGGM